MKALEIVRKQTSSGIEAQRNIAALLIAIESSLKEQNQELTPVAYYTCIVSVIEKEIENVQVLNSCLYLLNIVLPSCGDLLKLKQKELVELLIVILKAHTDAPLLRSCIGCLETVKVPDAESWQVLLVFCLDQRPKLRKKANEAVKHLLSNPPSPSKTHPFTSKTIEFCDKVLSQYDKNSENNALHILTFLKLIISTFGEQCMQDKVRISLTKLCQTLLSLPVKAGGNILTDLVFKVFDSLIQPKKNSLDYKLLESIIKSLVKMRPYQNDSSLTPTWLSLMNKCFMVLSESCLEYETGKMDWVDPNFEAFFVKEYPVLVSTFFNSIFKSVFDVNDEIKPLILQSACALLSNLIISCVSDKMILEAKSKEQGPLIEMANLIESSLTNIRFRDSWGYILLISSAVFERIGKEVSAFTYSILKAVMAFRDDNAYSNSFPYKDEMEVALCSAVQSLGIQDFCNLFPLNILNDDAKSAKRPYMLAVFGKALQNPRNTSSWKQSMLFGPHRLQFFIDELVPLSHALFEKAGIFCIENRMLEAKLYETLGLQIWDLFPNYCNSLPEDCCETFGKLAPIMGSILQKDPTELFPNLPSFIDLRPLVCDGLNNIVKGFKLLAETSIDENDDEEAKQLKNTATSAGNAMLQKFQKYSNRFLGALCNNYTTPNPRTLEDSKRKGQALQVLFEKEIHHYEKPIRTIIAISSNELITEYFNNLCNNINEMENAKDDLEKLRLYTIMELCLIFLSYLNYNGDFQSSLASYYSTVLKLIQTGDAAMVKKAYKALNAIIDIVPIDDLDQNSLVETLLTESTMMNLSSGTTKSRIFLFEKLLNKLESSFLSSFIPQILPEVMLATKETSEKSREKAYSCLIAIGRKMLDGGDIDMNGASKDMTDEDETVKLAEFSIKEYFMLVVAGLGGSTSQMQSAAIASLGRLLYEFHDHLDEKLTSDLLNTVLFAMKSNQTEVIKAALGFIKIAIVCLPHELVSDHLTLLIESILGQSHSKFKTKIRHILERLIRKFTFELIEMHIPEKDKKMINNIKKRRERSKRQKKSQEVSAPESKNATFEQVMRDSDSEIGSDNDENYIPEELADSKSKRQMQIREDEVVDFLDSAMISQVTIAEKKKKKAQALPTSQGKFVINEESSEENEMEEEKEDFYKESLESEVGFVRKADGRIKFNKINKRSREEEQGKRWGDQNKKKKTTVDYKKMLGRQYKSSKADGDVNRPGMPAPHAYIPLQAQIVGNM